MVANIGCGVWIFLDRVAPLDKMRPLTKEDSMAGKARKVDWYYFRNG